MVCIETQCSNLARQEAARKIGVGNSMAEEEKSLISSEQDLAAAARSVWRSKASAVFSAPYSVPTRLSCPSAQDAVG
jgi:hypothetical protein